MKDKKVAIRYFDIMDYEKEAAYLSDMHRQGWRFTRVGFPGIYHFEKCEPEQVRYQLDYNQEGIEHKGEYVQMFTDMGWEYLMDFMGYSYFRKAEEANEMETEIFCDDESRLDMVRRIIQGRVIPLIFIFFACLGPNIFQIVARWGSSDPMPMGLTLAFSILVLLYLFVFLRTATAYFRLKKKLGR